MDDPNSKLCLMHKSLFGLDSQSPQPLGVRLGLICCNVRQICQRCRELFCIKLNAGIICFKKLMRIFIF